MLSTPSFPNHLPTHCSSCGCAIHSHGLDLHPKFMRDLYNSDSEILHSSIVAEVNHDHPSNPPSFNLSTSDSLPSCLSSSLASSSLSSLSTETKSLNASSSSFSNSNPILSCPCSCHFNGRPIPHPPSTSHFHPDDVHPKILREIENHGTDQQRKMLDELKHGEFKGCRSCHDDFFK
ncbi:hypothetical protein HMI54_004662 [Coelomomyces lativittatus]|nr:hypothetical protein HMI56_003258 [Coelomomyces lativittatus]KAJ1506949.1 hypothetical protein HMI54_004662 [Coelomomyces lativittatus]KAJ1516515.1 hypothetical protein HMI55_002082 [Coelomomyces lativittatus]